MMLVKGEMHHQTWFWVFFLFGSFVFYECSENAHYQFIDDGDRSWLLPYEPPPLMSRSYNPTAGDLIKERTVSLEFSSRRRRFPFLKALVHHIVSPERRELNPLDIVAQPSIVPILTTSAVTNEATTLYRRPKLEIKEVNRVPVLEATTLEMITESDELNHIAEKPTRKRGLFLINVLSRVLKSVNFTAITEEMRNGRKTSRASCIACNAVAALYLSPLYSKEAMVAAARSVCISFRLQTPRVCRGLVDSFKDDLDFIRRNTKLNRQEMCGVVFGLDCSRGSSPYLNWTLPIPPDIRNLHHDASMHSVYRAKRNAEYGMPLYPVTETAELLPSVQITDIHIDPYYEAGMNADCGEPLCCRASDGVAPSSSKSAGIYGDYRSCDTPISALKSALEHISTTHPNAAYWMWTGDIAPHDIWNITRDEVIFQIRLVTDLIKQHAKVPVFPVIGNHEGVPVNSFPPPEVKGDLSISWLYDEIAKQWSFWLPEDAVETLRYGGYYRVKVRAGFRVICLNMNYCTRLNPWSLFDPVDPGKQLEWMIKEMVAAELEGDKVHIIGHIPPDNKECTQAWLFNYLRIVERFQDTILAQYFGHTHRDEFRVLFSPENKPKPISVAYIGPSITAFTENNPGYRVYYTDNAGYVKDHETYFYNLTEANKKFEPMWRKEYNALDSFNLTNMGPFGWHRFVSHMMDDDDLFQNFYKIYYRWSEAKRGESCYGECKKTIINDLIVGHPLKTKPKSLFGNRKHR